MKVVRGRSLLFAAISLALATCEPSTKTPDKPVLLASNHEATESALTSSNRPNVVWILLDAARARNFSAYGYARETSPNLDWLAQEGVLFENAFSQTDWTPPSVASYMTGRYFPGWSHRPQRDLVRRVIPTDEKLFPEILRENGYYTVMFSAHVWWSPGTRLYEAFDESHEPKVHHTNSKRAMKQNLPSLGELNEATVFPWLKQNKKEPFFLYVHCIDTHFPHYLDPPYDKWLDEDYQGPVLENGLPTGKGSYKYSEEDQTYLRGLYDGGILYADDQIGELVAVLEKSGLMERTVLVISSDHGELLGEDGYKFGHGPKTLSFDSLYHVPLIMVGPGFPRGLRVDESVENVDIVPTLIDVLHLKTDAVFDGGSLLPLIKGDVEGELHPYVFSKLYGYSKSVTYILRDQDFHYVWQTADDTEHLYAAPYDIGPSSRHTTDLLSKMPGVARKMKDYILEHLAPKYAAYKDRKVKGHVRRAWKSYDQAEPKEAFTTDSTGVTRMLRRDGKWSFGGFNWLWASPEESVPPLTLRLSVPNGHYEVRMDVLSATDWWGGDPASAFLYKAEDDLKFKKIVEARESSDTDNFRKVSLGPYTITDGVFDITLKKGDDNHWAIVRYFLFEESFAESEEALRSREEALEALGYIE